MGCRDVVDGQVVEVELELTISLIHLQCVKKVGNLKSKKVELTNTLVF